MHLPLVGRYAQRTFLSKMEDIAVMALAFCHSHEITLRDLEMYGVLQVSLVVIPETKSDFEAHTYGLCLAKGNAVSVLRCTCEA